MRRVVGIDCGMDGCVAWLEDGGSHGFYATPTLPKGKGGRQYDDASMADIVRQMLVPRVDLVVLEKQQAMPGQGVTSMFSVGLGFGLWRGLLAAFMVPVTIVHPRTWQAVMHRDLPGSDTKAKSLIACRRWLPDVRLRRTDKCRVDDHNMADAFLMARYGMWILSGGVPAKA